MKKTYRVGGAHNVLGHEPGSTFKAELDPEYEARLVERGSLSVVRDAPKPDPVSKSKGAVTHA